MVTIDQTQAKYEPPNILGLHKNLNSLTFLQSLKQQSEWQQCRPDQTAPKGTV